jgi:hypothetical protein
VLEDENNRLKTLLIATTVIYLVCGGLGIVASNFVYSDAYILWTFGRPWTIWISWLAIFITFSWIPLTLFCLFQGVLLKKKYSAASYSGDKTVGNLSVLLPVVFILIYILSRVIY